MSVWDVFHTVRLEGRKGLSTADVRSAVATGELREDDLARPAGSSEAWKRIGEVAELKAPPEKNPRKPREIPTAILLDDLDDASGAGAPRSPVPPPDREDRRVLREQSREAAELAGRERQERKAREAAPVRTPQSAGAADSQGSEEAIPVEEDDSGYDPLVEDEEATEFNLAPKRGNEREEDLDLAAMVDVAFQLIMFFLVTASSVFFKSMEIPPPNPDKQQAAQQASARTIDDLQNDNILVEIDSRGQILVDHTPTEASRLVEALRSAREASGRLSMLLMADLATPHRNAVLAYDAANEIGLTIKIGRPSAESD